MSSTRRSSRSERDNNSPQNSQNQRIDEVEFQNVFLFLFGIYAFATLLSRNAGPRAPNSDIDISIYRSQAKNRVDRSAGSAASAGPLVPYTRPAPPASAARAVSPAPTMQFNPTPPATAVPPAQPSREPPPAPPARFIPGPAPPSMLAAPAPPQQEIHPILRGGPAHQDRDAAHNNRQNYDPNQIIEELGGHSAGTLRHIETFRNKSGTTYGDIIGALHGIPDDNQIRDRRFVEVGEQQEENAVAQRQRGDPPGYYPAHVDKMGPQFAPFRQDREPEPPRRAQPPAPGQSRGNGIADVVVVNADGEFDPYFHGVNAADDGWRVEPYQVSSDGWCRWSKWSVPSGGGGDVGGWGNITTGDGAQETIEISDDEGAPIANDNSQGVRGRRLSPPRGTKRSARSSSGSPSARATKRPNLNKWPQLDLLPPPPRRGGARRFRNRSPHTEPPPPPRAPSGLPSPPDSQALARRQEAQVGLQQGAEVHPYARPARPINYVPEIVGRVRDPFDLLGGPVRGFETLTDLEKTDLVLNYCSGTHSRYIPFMRPKYHLGLSEDRAYRFSLQVQVYRNGDAETCQNAVEFFKCHPLHRAGSTKVSHCIPTSHLPRKPPHQYTDEELRKCDRETREKRELMRSRSTPGYAGSEYPHPQTVLRHKVTTYSHMDHWEFQLWSAEAAGPTIFSLRSAYKAATRADCLLTARLSYEGKEIAQCCMSALEDIQRGFTHEEGEADSPFGYGSLMSIGRDI